MKQKYILSDKQTLFFHLISDLLLLPALLCCDNFPEKKGPNHPKSVLLKTQIARNSALHEAMLPNILNQNKWDFQLFQAIIAWGQLQEKKVGF